MDIARFVRCRAIPVAILMTLAPPADAQDAPPPDVLNRIIDGLGKPVPRVTPVFEPAGTGALRSCLRPAGIRHDACEGDSATSGAMTCWPMASRRKRCWCASLAPSVDADGSERAYHPEDPSGRGVCTRRKGPDGKEKLAGICALDAFSSGGLRLYRDATLIPLMTSADDKNFLNPDFDREWKIVWPQIREKKLKALRAGKPTSRSVPAFYYLFYDKARRTTALFKNNIIPTDRGGYPCLRGPESRYPGYFVAATALQTNGAKARGDGCTPSSFIDAEAVPFFVLPHAATGRIGIGDIVIGHVKTARGERLVYGFAADIGPAGQFGEASYAFARLLRADIPEVPMNVVDVYRADIGPAWLRANNATLSILALGGTKALLRGDYSKENIERVGRAEFAKWNGNAAPTHRLNACVTQAKDNPAH